MAAWAACSLVSGGTMSRSVRWPRALVADRDSMVLDMISAPPFTTGTYFLPPPPF